MISRSSGRYVAAPLAALLVILFAAGCSPGVRWRQFSYPQAKQDATRDHKLMFVYFRHWAAVACTNFEDQVLKDPEVLEETHNFYCVPLAFDWDRPLAEQFGIREIPGVAIVDPDGKVITRLQARISRDDLLNEMRRALSEFNAHSAEQARR